MTGYGSLDLLGESIPIREGETSVDLADGATHLRDDRLGITRIAHLEIVVISDALGVRVVRCRLRLLPKALILGVLHHADHFDIVAVFRIVTNPESPAQRRTTREEPARHGLVDDGNFRRLFRVLRAEGATHE